MATPSLNTDFERRAFWQATMPVLPDRAGRQLADTADVVVIGGGYTGVNAARELARRGVAVTLVEAEHLGFGASTRNGGIVHPGYKWGPLELVRRYGEDTGRALYRETLDGYETVKRLIAEGFVGQPRHVLLTLANAARRDPTLPWSWWYDATRGGGLLGAVGSHQIDLLRYWLGEIESAQGTVETFVKERPTPEGGRRAVTADDFSSFALRFFSGAVGVVVLSVVAAHPLGPRTEVWGDEGTLVLDERDRLWGAPRGRELEELSEPETLTPPPGMNYAALWGLSFIRLVDHLAAAVLDKAPVTPAATFHDGLAAQRVMDAVRATTRSAWVPVGPTPASRGR